MRSSRLNTAGSINGPPKSATSLLDQIYTRGHFTCAAEYCSHRHLKRHPSAGYAQNPAGLETSGANTGVLRPIDGDRLRISLSDQTCDGKRSMICGLRCNWKADFFTRTACRHSRCSTATMPWFSPMRMECSRTIPSTPCSCPNRPALQKGQHGIPSH